MRGRSGGGVPCIVDQKRGQETLTKRSNVPRTFPDHCVEGIDQVLEMPIGDLLLYYDGGWGEIPRDMNRHKGGVGKGNGMRSPWSLGVVQ
jgi:hypothetical protein